jgi:hypothetical protein
METIIIAIPIDWLREQLAQGALISFSIDHVKAHDEPNQGTEKRHKLDQRKQGPPGGKEHEKNKPGLGHSFEFLLDVQTDHVGGDETHHGDQRKEDHEAVAREMICQFFSKDGPHTVHGYAS